MKKTYIPKEISWLYFNERVLQEAECKETPILERIKFLGIYSNNLDEFFRVRVATLKRLASLGKKAIQIISYNPKIVLKEINEIVLEQQNEFAEIFKNILKELTKLNIFIINEKQLSKEQEEFVHNYFHKRVRPKLMPIMFDQIKSFPDLKDEAIYFAVCLKSTKKSKYKYALIEIPSGEIPRFLVLPDIGDKKYLIMLDDIIRYALKDIFYIFDFDEIDAFTIKLTKDAELDINDDITDSYIKNISKSLKKRKEGQPVRFLFDKDIPIILLKVLTKKLKLKKDDAIIPGGRYHNFKDFIKFPKIGGKKFLYSDFIPVPHPEIHLQSSIFSSIREKDIMLHFPYHSFNYFMELLREASIDPNVSSIKITLYRVAKSSNVINTLINAAKNGKNVTALVELQARFDEEANILWSNKLRDEGVRVIHGVPGVKVHAKVCLLSRNEKGRVINYACLSTGNFNEDTAEIYADDLLITSNKKITNEAIKLFDFFDINYKRDTFYHLMVSPFNLRNKIASLINNEIKNAKKGKEAYIKLKLNNLVDIQIINLLYQASNAGVKVYLNIRGMNSLVPGIDEFSININGISIVDRFLEHTRILIFCNGNSEKYFISSADLMARNIDRRVEIICPIYDKNIQKELNDIFEIQWKDNVKARIIDDKMSNKLKHNKSDIKIHAQNAIYDYLIKKSN